MNEAVLKTKQALFNKLYSSLNEKQREAVFAPDGPILVIAGAGSGKTTVLVNRISYLIRFGNAYNSQKDIAISEEELMTLSFVAESDTRYPQSVLLPILSGFSYDPCPPDRILAITFTNKAASEIKERLLLEVGDDARQIWAGTFHSFCVRLLRRFSSFIPYGDDFIIYDQDDCKKLITNIMKEKEIDDQSITPKHVMNIISNSKNALIYADEFRTKRINSEKMRLVAEIFELYQKALVDANAMDFDDLIAMAVSLLKKNAEVLRWCQNKFRYVLVDEYQDTNRAQFLLMKLIAGVHKNVMVVGDDDQSIYKFRGADVGNILCFDQQFKDARVILLEQNYRSTKNILDAANALIANNRSRRGKTLWSHNVPGRKVAVRQLEDQEKEAVYIAQSISDLTNKDRYRLRDFAVLYRTKAQSNILETVFTKSGLPHRLLSGMRFYDHAEVKDILAYLRFIHNPNDFISMSRIINTPKRGIGNATVDKIKAIANEKEISLFDALLTCERYDELRRSADKIKKFAEMILSFKHYSAEHLPSELLHRVIDSSGYMQTLLGDENEDRRKNVDELISTAYLYEKKNKEPSLCGFLEEIALVSDVDNYDQTSDSVVLMTVHAAKGLEFPVVFIAGMEENLFPSPQSAGTAEDLEEERRLAYVAMTRAKRELFITYCKRRMIYGRTNEVELSRFIQEIPESLLDIVPFVPNIQSEYDYYVKKKPKPEIYSVSTSDVFSPAPKKSVTVKTGPEKEKKMNFVRFQNGDRVVHAIFGAGTVIETKNIGSDVLYRIRFDRVGEKKLMASYAKLRREM